VGYALGGLKPVRRGVVADNDRGNLYVLARFEARGVNGIAERLGGGPGDGEIWATLEGPLRRRLAVKAVEADRVGFDRRGSNGEGGHPCRIEWPPIGIDSNSPEKPLE
jgi:hypothetical protein